MTLGETKRHLTNSYNTLSNGQYRWVVRVGGRWTVYYAEDGNFADILLVRRFVEWLITICGSDADTKEIMDAVCEHPKFQKYYKGGSATFKAMIRIASNKAGYSILKAILKPNTGGDAAAQSQQEGGGRDGEDNPGSGQEQKDLQPAGGSQQSEDSEGDNPHGEGDSTQSEDAGEDHGADRDNETESPSSANVSPQAFWPEESELQFDAAARQAARILFSKIKKYSAGNATQAPLINSKKLIKELVTKRYNLTRIKGRSITNPRKTLIMVDVSGSCSSHSANTNAAAKAVYEAAPDLVVVMHHVNGIYKKHLGKMPECEMGEVVYADGDTYPSLEWWTIDWGLIVSFGDEDSLDQEIHACNNGTTVLKLDSHAKHHGGFRYRPNFFAHLVDPTTTGRYIYCQGCDDAKDLIEGLKLL